MKIAIFDGVTVHEFESPISIGDEVNTDGGRKKITNALVVFNIEAQKAEILFELDNSGEFGRMINPTEHLKDAPRH